MGPCLSKKAGPSADPSADDAARGQSAASPVPDRAARPAAELPPPEPCAEGSEELTVERLTAEERLGVHFRPGTLLLDRVNGDRAAARSGATEYIGRRVTHCDGVPVTTVAQFIAATQGREVVTLRFAPAEEAGGSDDGSGGDAAGGQAAAAGATGRAAVGSLQVTVHCAGALYAADRGGTSDPFVIVDVVTGGQQAQKKRKTAVRKKTLSPVWDERLEPFPLARGHAADALVRATVFDDNLVSAPEFLGFAELPLGVRRLAEMVARDEAVTLTLGPRPGNAADEALARRRGGQLGWLRISARAAMVDEGALAESLHYASSAWAQGAWQDKDIIPFSSLELTVACAWDLRAAPGAAPLEPSTFVVSVSASGPLQGAWGQGAPRETHSSSKSADPQWDQRFTWELAPGAEEQGIDVQLQLLERRKGEQAMQPISTAQCSLNREELRRALVRPRGRKLLLGPVGPEGGPPKSPKGAKGKKAKAAVPVTAGEALGTLMVIFRAAAQRQSESRQDAARCVTATASDPADTCERFSSGQQHLTFDGTPPCPLRDDDAASVHSLGRALTTAAADIRSAPSATMRDIGDMSRVGDFSRLRMAVNQGEVEDAAELMLTLGHDTCALDELKGTKGAADEILHDAMSTLLPATLRLRSDRHSDAQQLGDNHDSGGPVGAAALRPLSDEQLQQRLAAFFSSVGIDRDVGAILAAAQGKEDDLYLRLRTRWPQHAPQLEFLRAHWLLNCGGFVDDRSLPMEERLRRALAREGALRDCDRLLRLQHGITPDADHGSPDHRRSSEPWPQLCGAASPAPDQGVQPRAGPDGADRHWPQTIRPTGRSSPPAARGRGPTLEEQIARARAERAAGIATSFSPPPSPPGVRPRTPRRGPALPPAPAAAASPGPLPAAAASPGPLPAASVQWRATKTPSPPACRAAPRGYNTYVGPAPLPGLPSVRRPPQPAGPPPTRAAAPAPLLPLQPQGAVFAAAQDCAPPAADGTPWSAVAAAVGGWHPQSPPQLSAARRPWR
eukprot:TRINITY_DN2617_c0_g1_i1.p1 TRINITY_DN2617_c0_g1~~TRINITY_DN2617_c0_g1_i1.p1  ORF type:complete len:1054 (+),score=217.85 TRINITY_DN2617_c0_g1_i1:112-3162(+)